jgi:hypothetical protein
LENDMARSGFAALAGELWSFLRVRKKWWLAPILIIMALFGSLIVFTHGSALAPFVYTIF